MTENEINILNEINMLLGKLIRNPDSKSDIAKRLLFLGRTGVLPPKNLVAPLKVDYTPNYVKLNKYDVDFTRSVSTVSEITNSPPKNK
jgi:hypothetical protein